MMDTSVPRVVLVSHSKDWCLSPLYPSIKIMPNLSPRYLQMHSPLFLGFILPRYFISLPTGFLGRRLQQQECSNSCAAVGWKLKFSSYFGKSGSCEIFPSAMKPREKGFLFLYTRLVTEKKSSVFEGNSRNAYIRQGARNQQCFSHHAVYTCSEQDCTVLCFKEE